MNKGDILKKKTQNSSIADTIDEIDKAIITLKLQNRNLSLYQISQLLPKKMCKQAVHQRMQKPRFKAAWDSLELDVMFKLKDLQHKAVKVMEETLNSPDQRLRFQAAREILQKILIDSDGLLPDKVEDAMLEFVE